MNTFNKKSELEDKYAEDRKLFEKALLESFEERVERELKEAEEQNRATLGKEDEIRMNRFYREVIGGLTVLFPEGEG